MLGRPMVALRGSFRPRLASTTGEDPRATTDPVESPFEYSHGPCPANARAAVSTTTSWTPARASASAHAATVAPVVKTSSTTMTRRGTRALRRTGSNAPRMAARRSTPGRRACGAVATDRCRSRGTGRPSRLPTATRERPRLVVPTLGQPLPRERYPRDRVRGRRCDRDHGVGERGRDAPPPRELQPMDRRSGRAGVQERRTSEPHGRRRAVPAPIDRDGPGASASLAPRRPERFERGAARRHRTARCRGRTPRTAAGTRHRAPGRARHDASGPHRHRPRTAMAAPTVDPARSVPGRPRASIRSRDCVRMTG